MNRALFDDGSDWTRVDERIDRLQRLYPHLGDYVFRAIARLGGMPAVEYLEQAPVLLAFFMPPHLMSGWGGLTGQSAREDCARNFVVRIDPGPRLKDLMATYDAPLPLRKINARLIVPGYETILRALRAVPPSTLSQIIPQDIRGQRNWLRALAFWHDLVHRRRRELTASLPWIGRIVLDAPGGASVEEIREIADYMVAQEEINSKWTWARLCAESAAWHEAIAGKSKAARVFDSCAADYRGLPDIATVGFYEFRALRTDEALFDEGAAMRHCVSSYWPNVRDGYCFIYSIRVAAQPATRLATLEVDSDGLIRQLCGPRNRAVLPSVASALREFVKAHMAHMPANKRGGKG